MSDGDGTVNIIDLTLVAGALGETAAATSVHAAILEHFTISPSHRSTSGSSPRAPLDLTDATFQSGLQVLEQLLRAHT